jgi:hydrogenase expression/formation protein HypC
MCLAVPGQIEEVHEQDGLRVGRVRFGGATREAVLEHVADAGPGDWVLVHVGFAIARLDEAEARRTWELLSEAERIEAELAGEEP